MKPSPLQLERSFFSRVHLDATREATVASSLDVTTTTQFARHAEDPRRWMVTLCVVLLRKEGEADPPPYTGELEAVGFFSVDKDFPEEGTAQLVAANAPAVLYGMAREMVFLLTARGPHRPQTLPTVTFTDQTLKLPEAAPAAAPLAPADRPRKTPRPRRPRSAGGASTAPS